MTAIPAIEIVITLIGIALMTFIVMDLLRKHS
jgi:hypothetical protein